MAPYAVSHFKLALQLAGHDLPERLQKTWAYDFAGDERIGIYLTNTLEGPHEHAGLPLFAQFLAQESAAANEIKQRLPIMVVVGNPPYAGHSANQSPWIDDLLHGRLPDGSRTTSYYEVDGKPLGEQNPKYLLDDYVKFMRFGQWRISQSGGGILAFVTNHGYLDNPTFRGMRQSLMETFSEIYVLDLHGNVRKKETAPDGSADENVFDIMQGTAIGIFVKEPGREGPATVYHCDLWGRRADKYRWLSESDTASAQWTQLDPHAPFYLFVRQSAEVAPEYEQGWSITDIMPINSTGIKTHRDHFAVAFDRETILSRIREFRDLVVDERVLRNKYKLRDTRDWKLGERRSSLSQLEDWPQHILECHYRPLDIRYIYYHPAVVELPRSDVMDHLTVGRNLALNTNRQVNNEFQHALCTNRVTTDCTISGATRERSSVFPLFLYPAQDSTTLFDDTAMSPWPPDEAHSGRVPNLAADFIGEMTERLGLTFDPHKTTTEPGETFGPEDVFRYIYAILHSPTYRERYAEFLKINFPRIPITSEPELFWRLVSLGDELVRLHLLEHPKVREHVTEFNVRGTGQVGPRGGYPKYTPPNPERGIEGRVWINDEQYFEGVPEDVWEFQVGGYQVLHKWLKDRRGRVLTYDDVMHYHSVVVALQETSHLMQEIDEAIPTWPIT